LFNFYLKQSNLNLTQFSFKPLSYKELTTGHTLSAGHLTNSFIHINNETKI